MAALEPIFAEYYPKLAAEARYMLADEGEDAASTVMVKLVEYAKSFDGGVDAVRCPDAFMRTLVKRTAIDMLRARKRLVGLDAADSVPSDADVESAVLGRNDALLGLWQLPDAEREIAVMHYIYGTKINDIADSLDIPIGTVKWRLSNIRKKMLKKLS